MQFSQRSQPLCTSTATRSPTRNSSTPGPGSGTGQACTLMSSAPWRTTAFMVDGIAISLSPFDDAPPLRALGAEGVPGEAGHGADELIGGGEAGRAVGKRGGNMFGVDGQDEERRLALEDDAGVHEAAGARARLVRDLGAERQLRGQA